MVIRKEIVLTLLLSLFSCLSYSQNQDGYFINDKNVRLREQPSLDGKIIRSLGEKEKIIYLDSQDPFDGSDFKWIQVKTSKDQGWVFGEFISRNFIKKCSFECIEDAGVRIENKGIILSGIHEEEIIKVLGQPLSREYDEEYNEYTLTYGLDGKLTLLVHKYNQRLHHIIIESPAYVLTNNVKIGMNISEINNSNVTKGENNSYNYYLQNNLRTSFYDSDIIIMTDEEGIIQEIQIGLPQR